ncbi:MAG TPA: sterol desaturase family protein [Terriglobia bacterium]|nr:sterol desaturase family protein [Terriglobia bacterium]
MGSLPWSSSSPNTDLGVSRSARLKRANALTAVAISSVCSTLLALRYPAGPGRWLVGLLAGLLWANGFEYLYHRYLLHAKRGFQARFHLKHHATTDTVEEPEHVNLAASPFWVAVMFLLNGAVAVGLDVLFSLRIVSGALLAFGLYFVLVDEIHWRIHLRGRLPPGLGSAADYHLMHHNRPDARFNIFLPLFDWLLGTARSERAN